MVIRPTNSISTGSFTTCAQQYEENEYSSEWSSSHSEDDQVEDVDDDDCSYCDACDRSFYSNQALVEHRKEHQTCGIDGCKYNAHFALIEKHIRMQHTTGLYSKISSGNSPEDIAKWREERKKNYPSKENIIERQKKQEELMKRGEKLWEDTKKKRFAERKKRNELMREKAAKKRTKRLNKNKKRKQEFSIVEDSDDEDNVCDQMNGNLPMFKGIKQLLRDDGEISDETDNEINYDIDDSEWDVQVPVVNITPTPAVTFNSSLSGLISAYASTDESDDPERVQKSTPPTHVVKNNDDDDGPPEELKIEHIDPNPIEISTDFKVPDKPTSRKRKRRGKKSDEASQDVTKKNNGKMFPQNVFKPRRRPTLLERLLTNEIRHVRNVILQCVRFCVENNFFQ